MAGRDRDPSADREAGLALVSGPVAGRFGVVGGMPNHYDPGRASSSLAVWPIPPGQTPGRRMTTGRAWRLRIIAVLTSSFIVGVLMATTFDVVAEFAGWAPGTDEGMGTDMLAAFIFIVFWWGSAWLLFRWWQLEPPPGKAPPWRGRGRPTVPPEEWGKPLPPRSGEPGYMPPQPQQWPGYAPPLSPKPPPPRAKLRAGQKWALGLLLCLAIGGQVLYLTGVNDEYAGPCETGDTGVLYSHPVRSIAGFAVTVAAALVVLVMMLRARPRPSAGARPAFMIATFSVILVNVGWEVLTPVLLQLGSCE
jgi:hypothetical protein